jgi:hypothetical protein
MMTTTAKFLNTLSYYNEFSDYNVIGQRLVERTISRPLPFYTGFGRCGHFPSYIVSFKYCYEKWGGGWRLKEGYRDNRLLYSVDVQYWEYDIELTERGKEKLKWRYEMFKRNAEKYEKLLEKLG